MMIIVTIRLRLPLREVLLPQLLKPARYCFRRHWEIASSIRSGHVAIAARLGPFCRLLGSQSNCCNVRLYNDNTQFFNVPYPDHDHAGGVSLIMHMQSAIFLYLAYNAGMPIDTPPDQYIQRVSYIAIRRVRLCRHDRCAG